jgi:hypothetical protein
VSNFHNIRQWMSPFKKCATLPLQQIEVAKLQAARSFNEAAEGQPQQWILAEDFSMGTGRRNY